MKKVININFQGRVIPIEETAYDILKQYIESLRRYFINEEGRDEIINDIESRIAELFGETLKKGSTCITDEDVNAIIASIGRPEDFDDAGEKVSGAAQENNSSYSYATNAHRRLYRTENDKVIAGVCGGIANYFGIDPLIVRILFVVFAFGFGFGFIVYLVLWVAVPSTASTIIGSAKKRLLRDPEDKIIAGVCQGLAYYFGVNVWIPRILFLIPFISFIFRWSNWGDLHYPNFFTVSFSPAATIIYIILWLVLPEAKSTSDRLEMKGEKVNLNSIKNNITEEMKGFGERVSKFSTELGEKGKQLGERSKQFGNEFSKTAQRSSHGLGNVIALIFKIFAYFIVAVILFAVISALFGIGVAMLGLLPWKDYLLNNGWENVFAWGTLILFIWVPVIGIITFIIRRIAKMRNNAQAIRISFLSLWLLGLICAICLVVSLINDFKYSNVPAEQNVLLTNAGVNKLELKAAQYGKFYNNFQWLRFEPFARIDEDTMYINNVFVRIVKSDTDSFAITLVKRSDGASRHEATELTSRINYNISQQDSVLLVKRGIGITKNEKFRNQSVIVSVAVPVGKKIKINGNVTAWEGRLHFGWHNEDDWRWNNDADYGMPWEYNVEYIMTNDGLQRTDGKINSDDDENNDADKSIEDYNNQRLELEKQREEKRKELQQLDSALKKVPDTVVQPAKPTATLPVKTAAITETPAGIANILFSRMAI